LYTQNSAPTWNIENKFLNKVETKYIGNIPMVSLFNPSISFNVEFFSSKDLGEMSNDQAMEEVDYDCFAPPGKYYKCRATTDKYLAKVPYYLDRTIYFYDGTRKTKRIDTTYQGILTSSINFERCCYGKNCDQNMESLCGGELKKEAGQCPKLEDALPLTKANQLFKPDSIKLEPELDLKVITDIKMIIGINSACSKGYTFVQALNPKDNTKGSDMKPKFETNFKKAKYFMCVKMENISKLKNYNVVNAIKLNKRNEDCGLLNSVKQNTNEASEVQICYGYDGDRDLYPISDMIFTKEKDVKMANSRSYKCADEPIGKFRLCYKVFKNATKRMSLRNFSYDYELSKKMQIGPPKILAEVKSSGLRTSTVAKSIKRRLSYVNKLIELGSGITFDATGTYETSSVNLNGKNKENINVNDKFESVSFECNGPEPRTFKCIASVFTYRIFVPYTADLVHYDYQGKEIYKVTKPIKGVSDDLLSSGIRVNKCCVSNCCTGFEAKGGPRQWCLKGKKKAVKDILCSKLEKCYNEFPLKAAKGAYW